MRVTSFVFFSAAFVVNIWTLDIFEYPHIGYIQSILPVMRRRKKIRPQTCLTIIGHKLSALRQSENISLETASQALSMSTTRLRAIELGQKNYSLELLFRICHYYKVSVLEVVS